MNNKTQRELDEIAINEAGWEFVHHFSGVTGYEIPAWLFNSCKPLIRLAIIKYLDLTEKDKPV